MGLVDDTRVKLLLAAFVLSLLSLVAIVAVGAVAALSALADPAYAGVPLPFVLLDAAAPYLVASALVGGVSFLLFVVLAVAAVRRASTPRDERLARIARKVECHFPEARSVGLAERFEPTTEDRIGELKEQYVDGEIAEWEYERRLQELLADDDVSDERVRREREQPERERTFGR